MTDVLRVGDRPGGRLDEQQSGPLLLAAGFLAVTVAILVAHTTPATGYEVSVYAATPTVFWAGIAVGIGAALWITFRHTARPLQAGAGLLAVEAFLAVVALPLVRGYEFYSPGDALSHLGWVRNVLANELALTDLIYPGLHSIGIYFHRLLGVPLESALLLTVVTFAAMFVVFVPMVVYTLTARAGVALFGLFGAMMTLPINNISAHLTVFPSTMAVFFLPFVLVLLTVGIREAAESSGLTPTDALLSLASVCIVLIHPQQAANLLVILVVVSGAVLVSRYFDGIRSPIPLSWHPTVLALTLGGWALLHDRITETAVSYSTSVAEAVLGNSGASASAINQRTGSLSAIGASPAEILVKLFLASAVYAALTACVLAIAALRSRREEYDRTEIVLVGLGLFPVGLIMILYVLGDLQTIYFRHLGFIMAFVTIFGAIGFAWVTGAFARNPFGRLTVSLAAVAMTALLVLSLVTMFPTPFIYQPNSHVTEMQLDGHATAFAYENESVPYAGVRTGPDRFRDAIQGTFDLESRTERRATRLPFDDEAEGLDSAFDETRYVVVSEADVKREVVAYRGLRYSEDRLTTFGDRPGVDRVISNGEFRLYRVDS